VKGVVTKVTAGEADAGIVYVTDVTAAGGKAAGVDIPAAINVVAQYPIATVKTSTKQDVDQAFIDFLLGDDGQAIMAKYGFGSP
jgi:molybdate transport system substrate-binding protein